MSPPEADSESCNRRFLQWGSGGNVSNVISPQQKLDLMILVITFQFRISCDSAKVPLNLLFSDSTSSTGAAWTAPFQIYFIFEMSVSEHSFPTSGIVLSVLSLYFIQFSDSQVLSMFIPCHANETCDLLSSILTGLFPTGITFWFINIHQRISGTSECLANRYVQSSSLDRKKRPWVFNM